MQMPSPLKSCRQRNSQSWASLQRYRRAMGSAIASFLVPVAKAQPPW